MKTALASEALLGAALAGRAPRGDASASRADGAGFAGLLDGARQRLDGRSNVYDGSAFDVPEAKRSAAPSASATADAERRQIDQRQQRARHDAQREAAPAEHEANAKPRAAESRPAASTQKPRNPDAPRDADRAREGKAPDEATASAESTAAEAPGARAASATDEPQATACPTTQDWMNRWAAMPAAGMSPSGAAEAEPAAALPRLAAAAGAAPQGEAVTASASQLPGPAVEAAAMSAALAASTEPGTDASTPAVAAARVEAPSALPPGHAAAPASATTAPSAPAPATASVPVPLDAPDFSQALGWQLATLARDGVHEAQLQLNPVEMGPVQVQILLDGGQAQIDFTAAQARTREVLEAGWPALAAAMNAAGFTLGGGGVSEQRSQDRDGSAADHGSRRGARGDDADALPMAGVTRLASSGPRGLLDLYA